MTGLRWRSAFVALASAVALAGGLPGAAQAQGPHAHHAHHVSCGAPAHDAAHSAHLGKGEKVKAGEHAAMMDLVPLCAASDRAVRAGAWSDPQTWQNGRVPAAGARVLIPAGIRVELDGARDGVTLDWVRVDGHLSFAPERNTALQLRTLVVSASGRFDIGTPDAPVAANVTARLLFAPRDGRAGDPFDLAGGLLSHGLVTMVGAKRSSHHATAGALRPGATTIALKEPPSGWTVGDQVLLPGTDLWADQDEQRTIAAIAHGTIALDRPLAFAHEAPPGAAIPLGNLTRNIEVRSLETAPLAARAHAMIMHVQSGTLFDGVAFLNLGRTDTLRAHTFPEVDADGQTKAGSDANTIGRYAVHFHLRSGGLRDVAPHVVRNSVVIDSPKFGIVNHGGHVVAEDNVTFRVAGSHLVAENGSEVGAFRRNMTVRSSGGGDAPQGRMYSYDFGHDGAGIWLQGAGVEATDNWASGHAGGGIFLMNAQVYDSGDPVQFNGANLPRIGSTPRPDPAFPSDVTAYLARNTIAASRRGIDIWDHKFYAKDDERTLIEDSTIWNVETGVHVAYSAKVTFRGLTMAGPGLTGRTPKPGLVGFSVNNWTEDLVIERADISGFDLGVMVSRLGHNVVRDSTIDALTGVQILGASLPDRHVHLDRLDFRNTGAVRRENIRLADAEPPWTGAWSMLFEDDRIDLTDRGGRNWQLFFPSQRPDAVPFREQGPEILRGLTSGEIYRKFNLAIGGELAPPGATPWPGSRAYATPAPLPRTPAARTHRVDVQRGDQVYPMQSVHFVAAAQLPGTDEWSVVPRDSHGSVRGRLVYMDRTPPKFMLRRGLLPMQIHPDDIRYGYRVSGYVLDRIAGRVSGDLYEQYVGGLEADPDGIVRIRFSIRDFAGNETPIELPLRVTTDAVRRGANVGYYSNRAYCGACGEDTVDYDSRQFYETEELRPLGANIVFESIPDIFGIKSPPQPWGYNQTKIVRQGETAYLLYNVDSADCADDRGRTTIFRKIGDGPWQRGKSFPFPSAGLLVDRLGRPRVYGYWDGKSACMGYDKDAGIVMFTADAPHEIASFSHEWVEPPGTTGTNGHTGGAVDGHGNIIIEEGNNGGDVFGWVKYVSEKGTFWDKQTMLKKPDGFYAYPFVQPLQRGYWASLSTRDPQHDKTMLLFPRGPWSWDAVALSGPRSGDCPVQQSDIYEDSIGRTHFLYLYCDGAKKHVDHLVNPHAAGALRLTDVQLHDTNANDITDSAPYVRLVEIDGRMFYIAVGDGKVRFRPVGGGNGIAPDYGWSSIDIPKELLQNRSFNAVYTYVSAPRGGGDPANRFVDILAFDGYSAADGLGLYIRIRSEVIVGASNGTAMIGQRRAGLN